MENISWLFDGLGTMVISLIVGIIGSFIGYKVGVKKGIEQSQTAGNNAKQTQFAQIREGIEEGPESSEGHIKQSQKAGDNSAQNQEGGF